MMKHYVAKDAAGNIHVQNAVMGYLGQHHVHTPADFRRWRKDVDKAAIVKLDRLCACGMKPGEVKEGH